MMFSSRKSRRVNSLTEKFSKKTFNKIVPGWLDLELFWCKIFRKSDDLWSFLQFVISFTRAKFLENKIYTEKRQFSR